VSFIIGGVCFVFVRDVRACIVATLVTGLTQVVLSLILMAQAYVSRPSVMSYLQGSGPNPFPQTRLWMAVYTALFFASCLLAGVLLLRHTKIRWKFLIGLAAGVLWFFATTFVLGGVLLLTL